MRLGAHRPFLADLEIEQELVGVRITTTREVADELWRMAKEYQAQAAEMGDFPEIGDEPPLGSRPRP